jgi:hypothetical protein
MPHSGHFPALPRWPRWVKAYMGTDCAGGSGSGSGQSCIAHLKSGLAFIEAIRASGRTKKAWFRHGC